MRKPWKPLVPFVEKAPEKRDDARAERPAAVARPLEVDPGVDAPQRSIRPPVARKENLHVIVSAEEGDFLAAEALAQAMTKSSLVREMIRREMRRNKMEAAGIAVIA